MKKVLISLLLVIATCSCKHINIPYGTVTCVEEKAGGYLSSRYGYKVTVRGMDWTSASCEMILYTNDKYEIGDTLTIVKK